jgi:hypothetical protein
MLRIPHCLDNRLIDGGQVVSLTRRPCFTPINVFGSINNSALLNSSLSHDCVPIVTSGLYISIKFKKSKDLLRILRLCALEVRVPAYRSRGPGLIPGDIRFSEK